MTRPLNERRSVLTVGAAVGSLLLLGLAMLVPGCRGGEKDAAHASAPFPVILISIDTLRSDRLPAYGYRGVSTPAIDALRGDGVLFERAYSHSPMTLPSHVSMLTGALPAAHGVRNNVGYTWDVKRGFSLPCFLRERGFATGAAVSTYVLRRESGMSACFDEYDDALDPRGGADGFSSQQRSGWQTLERAKAWIGARGEEPFFYMFHIYEPHVPYDPGEPYRSLYADPYDGEIALADAIVGDFVSWLRARGIYDRALVILTSDHGEGLGDHGEEQHSVLLNRELIQVPLMIKLPAATRAGDSVAAPVQLVDLAPTITDALGLGLPSKFEGTPLLRGDPGDERVIFSETLYPRIHLGWSDLASGIRGRYHLIEGPDPELYDLVADPGERNNILATERRVGAALRNAIAPYRVPMGAIEAVDPETAAKMAALGYVGGAVARTGALPDPKAGIRDLETIRRALQLSAAGRFGEAEPLLEQLLARQPRMSEAWAKLGEIRLDAGDARGAAEAYREALRTSPLRPPDLLLDAAAVLIQAGAVSEAESLARIAVAQVPSRGHEQLARAAMARGAFPDAEREARMAAGDPPRPSGLVLVADLVQRQGRADEALSILRDAEARSAAIGGGAVRGLEAVRGDILAKRGDAAGAREAYRKEIDAFPSNLDAWSRLCVIVFVDGEGDRAGVDRLLHEMATKNPGPRAAFAAARTLEALDDPAGAARWRKRATRG